MHQSIAISLASTALLAATAASAKTLRIDVGKGGLAFAPNSVTASKGDVVEFHFGESTTHNVVAGDFESPCQPASSGGFYSGAMAGGSGMLWSPVFSITVEDDSKPTFFYCSIENHCNQGMVGVINPSGPQTLAKYGAGAGDATVESPSVAPFGGEVGGGGGAGSSIGGDETSSAAQPPAMTTTSVAVPTTMTSVSSEVVTTVITTSAMMTTEVATSEVMTTEMMTTEVMTSEATMSSSVMSSVMTTATADMSSMAPSDTMTGTGASGSTMMTTDSPAATTTAAGSLGSQVRVSGSSIWAQVVGLTLLFGLML